MPEITCLPATLPLLEEIWDRTIRRNPGDDRWVRWKAEAISNNQSGRAQTFLILADGVPVGEGTLLFSPVCSAIRGRLELADGETVTNLNALRIEKRLEGQGHISRLVRLMEDAARTRGYRRLTIGVEARETRNLAIYLHWGYDRLVRHEIEDGELVLYFEKTL